MKMTQKTAKDLVAMLGLRLRRNVEWDEFVVVDGEATYHCDDLDDALGTALVMAGSHTNAEYVRQEMAKYQW